MPDDMSEAARLEKAVADAKELLGMTGCDHPRVDDPLALWSGSFGDLYADRCKPSDEEIAARTEMWREIVGKMDLPPAPQIAEIGANQGQNLEALHRILPLAALFGIEPNDKARGRIKAGHPLKGTAYDIPLETASVDLAFTSGVLIHIPPDKLEAACREIHRISRRYIVAVEYFRATPAEVLYQGHGGALWCRDFGGYWLDTFPDLKPVAAGFSWRRLTGLDDVTWQVLEKPEQIQVYDIHTDRTVAVTKRAGIVP